MQGRYDMTNVRENVRKLQNEMTNNMPMGPGKKNKNVAKPNKAQVKTKNVAKSYVPLIIIINFRNI